MHATGIINTPELVSQEKSSRRVPKYLPEFIEEGVKDVPLRERHTQQKLATLMGVSETAVHHWIVASMIRVHYNSLKPLLLEENKSARFEMALYFRDPDDPTKYQDMQDWIHVDEKWFFLIGKVPPPSGQEKHKALCKTQVAYNKVMFLCTVVRPHFNPSANSWWDGKLGIWPIG